MEEKLLTKEEAFEMFFEDGFKSGQGEVIARIEWIMEWGYTGGDEILAILKNHDLLKPLLRVDEELQNIDIAKIARGDKTK